MKRLFSLSLVAVLAACGGGEPATDAPAETEMEAEAEAAATGASTAPAAPTGEMTMPSWFEMDEASQTVNITLVAGANSTANYWNYHGATNGNLAITVPEGYTVTMTLQNDDPNMAHSAGIEAQIGGYSAAPQPNPAFDGAVTSNPTSMVDGTMPGESETITFTASTPGEYAIVCYVPGHAATGMWVRFNVSADGGAGVQGYQM